MAIGGSIQAALINSRNFPVASDADITKDLGGVSSEVMPNGDGSARKIQTRKKWMIEGLQVEIDDQRADLEFLQEIANSSEYVPIALIQVDGTTYQGTGTIEGDIKGSTQSATATINLGGPNTLEKQS